MITCTKLEKPTTWTFVNFRQSERNEAIFRVTLVKIFGEIRPLPPSKSTFSPSDGKNSPWTKIPLSIDFIEEQRLKILNKKKLKTWRLDTVFPIWTTEHSAHACLCYWKSPIYAKNRTQSMQVNWVVAVLNALLKCFCFILLHVDTCRGLEINSVQSV